MPDAPTTCRAGLHAWVPTSQGRCPKCDQLARKGKRPVPVRCSNGCPLEGDNVRILEKRTVDGRVFREYRCVRCEALGSGSRRIGHGAKARGAGVHHRETLVCTINMKILTLSDRLDLGVPRHEAEALRAEIERLTLEKDRLEGTRG